MSPVSVIDGRAPARLSHTEINMLQRSNFTIQSTATCLFYRRHYVKNPISNVSRFPRKFVRTPALSVVKRPDTAGDNFNIRYGECSSDDVLITRLINQPICHSEILLREILKINFPIAHSVSCPGIMTKNPASAHV
jgi:hypothetical protein